MRITLQFFSLYNLPCTTEGKPPRVSVGEAAPPHSPPVPLPRSSLTNATPPPMIPLLPDAGAPLSPSTQPPFSLFCVAPSLPPIVDAVVPLSFLFWFTSVAPKLWFPYLIGPQLFSSPAIVSVSFVGLVVCLFSSFKFFTVPIRNFPIQASYGSDVGGHAGA